MPIPSLRPILPGVLSLCLFLSTGWGREEVGQWTRGESGSSPPIWMSAPVWYEQAGMEIWRTEIRPSGTGQGLLLSTVFRAEPGGFVRVIWKNALDSVTLSADLSEGELPLHQRSLWIDASRLAGSGQIWIEAKGASLERVRLELMSALGWGTGQQGEFVHTASGRLLRAGDLYGDAFRPGEPENNGGVVEASLHPGPLSIQQRPIRLHVPVTEKVDYARLEFWVAGLGADEVVLFSLNEDPLEELFPDVPSLEDPGYEYSGETGRTELAGWRRVVRFISGPHLKKGKNTFWLGSGASAEVRQVVIRDLRLQVVFSAQPVTTAGKLSENSTPPRQNDESPANDTSGLSFRSEGVGLRP